MNTYLLQVEGMSCSHCVRSVQEAVEELKGTFEVKVDLDKKSVSFQMDDQLQNLETVKLAIEDAGYDVV